MNKANLHLFYIMTKRFLLINPYIYDFAAYDLWSKPLGLLIIARLLKDSGHQVNFLDLQDYSFASEKYPFPKRKGDGTGHIRKTRVQKPKILQNIPRYFCRYGIAIEDFENHLKQIEKPDFIFITSQMTYWYPGIVKTMQVVRHFFDSPIVLGGIYATLCFEHSSRHIGINADYVVPGHIFSLRARRFFNEVGIKIDYDRFSFLPDYSVYSSLDVSAIMISIGCPYNCRICASGYLFPRFIQFEVEKIADYIAKLIEDFNLKNIAFYDDALLTNHKKHLIPILKRVYRQVGRVNYHTPNGLQMSEISQELAEFMKEVGFAELRVSFEGVGVDNVFDKPISKQMFIKKMKILRDAGFEKQIRVYLITGVPGQKKEDLLNAMYLVHSQGGRIDFTYYSLIPFTWNYERDCRFFGYSESPDPLLHNTTLWHYRAPEFSCWADEIVKLKNELNHKLGY